MSAREFFNSIMQNARSIRVAAEAPPQPPGPEDVLAEELSMWASSSACEDYFLPWLEARIDAADKLELEFMGQHPVMTYHKGRKGEASFILSQFRKWIETNQARPRSVLDNQGD